MNLDTPFMLGKWTIEPALNRILSEEQDVVLVPKVMTLLLYLVENAGEPVSQDALFERVWPGQVVSDSSLYQAIAQLRKALGDSGKTKSYIERVSGKGYRLIAPVTPCSSNCNSTYLPRSLKSNRSFGRIITFLIVLIVLASGLTLWKWDGQREEFSSNVSSNSPPLNLSVDEIESIAFVKLSLEQSSVSEVQKVISLSALNDVLLTQLMHIGGMRVISLSHLEQTPNVDAILKGKIIQQAKVIRVFLQLEQTVNQQVIWAKVFEGTENDLFGLQDQIVDHLLTIFGRQQPVSTFGNTAVEKRVFDQYILGRHLREQRNVNSLNRSKTILEDLQRQQKLFPLAAVALCETYHFLYIYSDWSLQKASRQCKPLLDEALLRQPALGQAIAAKGLLLSSDGQRNAAEKLFKRAIQLAPNYAFAYMWYGNLIRDMGRYDEALRMTQKAYELSPMSPIINRSLAYSYLNLRKVRQADYYYQRALAIEPDHAHRPVNDLDFYPLTAKRASEYLDWASRNPLMLQRHPNFRLTQAQVFLALGEYDKVEEIIEEFDSINLNPSFTLYVKATFKIAQNDFETAARIFEQRRQLYNENSRFDMPYIHALFLIGQFDKAEKLFLTALPEFNNAQIQITTDNVYRASFYIQLLRAANSSKDWMSMARQVDRVFTVLEHPGDIYVAEWLVFRSRTEEAKSIVLELMNSGWLPDTNAESFARHRMRNLFIETGLGDNRFETLLQRNITAVLQNVESAH